MLSLSMVASLPLELLLRRNENLDGFRSCCASSAGAAAAGASVSMGDFFLKSLIAWDAIRGDSFVYVGVCIETSSANAHNMHAANCELRSGLRDN